LQTLLDLDSVFNIVSSVSKKKQCVKLTHEGIEENFSLKIKSIFNDYFIYDNKFHLIDGGF